MKEFSELWDDIVKRSAEQTIPVVQDRTELEYVFNLLKGCNSYLEIGAAEGNSLYVLAQAMPCQSRIHYIDWAEKHTEAPRQWVLDRLKEHYSVVGIHEDSNSIDLHQRMSCFTFDALMIDAGHETWNVVLDAMLFGHTAKKYIIFHDIQLPDVNQAFTWYCKQRPECKNYRVVNSPTYGYGIIEL